MGPGGIVNHVGQCVVDLERSVRFYTELLGFELDRTLELPDAAVSTLLSIEPPVGLHAVYLRQGDFQLELMQFDRAGNPAFTERVFNEPGLTHLSVCVDDLDDARARVADLGGTIVTDLGGVLLVRDPDGQLLELLPMSFRSQRHAL
jgi:catechol 2,3-dioxygenase-like lactoylglutathione lyase family enzyme